MLESHPDGVVLEVWVIPGASRTEVTGVHDGALRVRVAWPPADGAANAAVIKLLKGIFDARVELVGGASSRRKRFLLETSLGQAESALYEIGAIPEPPSSCP